MNNMNISLKFQLILSIDILLKNLFLKQTLIIPKNIKNFIKKKRKYKKSNNFKVRLSSALLLS